MKKVFAMLPCYNEGEDISPLVHKWMKMKELLYQQGYELYVFCIDDKSKDNTKVEIQRLSMKFSGSVYLIEHKVNLGLGGALKTSFNYFYDHGKTDDLCVIMDGDNTHDPIYLLDMISSIIEGFDCVIASRYCIKSEIKGVSGIRLFMSWSAKQYYSIVLKIEGVKDYTCGYRAYTFDLISRGIREYGDFLVEKRSFACMMEVLYKLSLLGAKFAEVPFELRYDNKRGVSKMKIIKTARESMETALYLRFKKRNKSSNR